MNAQQLMLADGSLAPYWMCSTCHNIYNTKEYTNTCCICRYCGEATGNPKIYEHYECLEKRDQERYQKRIDNAVDMADEEYVQTEMFYAEEWGTFFDDIEDERDYHDVTPEYIFPCTRSVWPGLDIENVLDTETENYVGEDSNWRDYVVGFKEFKEAVDKFNELNKNTIYCFEPDYKRKFRVDKTE
jgi:hypothetical protein